MVSFVPQNNEPLQYGPSLKMRIAGAESNTAIGLTKLGHTASFISCVGADSLGQFLLRMLRAEGVDTSAIRTLEDYPTGIMLKEPSPSGTSCFYYRSNSAASNIGIEDIPETLFTEADIFHFTGITPILSNSCKDTILHAIELAKRSSCRISFDPNIRLKLWRGEDHAPLMRHLIEQTNYLMIGLDEADTLYHTKDINSLVSLFFTSPNLEVLAIKDGANGVTVSDGKITEFIPPYSCCCIDPVGAGDAFNAGFLSGLLRGAYIINAGKMGAISGARATETRGDIEGLLTYPQLQNIMNGIVPVDR